MLNHCQDLFRENIIGTHQNSQTVAVAKDRFVLFLVYIKLVAAAIPPFAAVGNLEL